MPATSATAAIPQLTSHPIGISKAIAALCRTARGMRFINLGGLVGNENASVAGGVGMSSESEESLDLGEKQIAVFKSFRKSDGTSAEPAKRTPEPAHGGHIPPCPCLLKTPVDGITWKTSPHTVQEPTSDVGGI